SNTSGWTKYIPSGMKSYWYPSGDPDNKTVLGLENDPACYVLGDHWRMPTKEEFQELIDNCFVEWIQLNGVNGIKFTSKKNGNRIFLPATGYRTMDQINNVGSDGFYWSSSLHTGAPDHAYNLTFSSTEVQALSNYRFTGRTVRPIFMVKVTGVGLNATSLSMLQREAYTLSAIITPYNAYDHSVSWESDNTEVAMVDATGKVTAVGKGDAIITARTTDGGFTATCSVSVQTVDVAVPQSIDLGLSVQWASFNLGATKPEESGHYYQWAGTRDVSDTSIFLDWKNCPFHTSSMDEKTGWLKYIPSDMSSYWSGSGSPDNKMVLDPENDAAYVDLGDSWRMPTKEEFQELIDNCSVEWTQLNGVNGRKFTSIKNGNSIFLPASGCRNEGVINSATFSGTYWTLSLNIQYPYTAYSLYFHRNNFEVKSLYKRSNGLSVRPVRPEFLSEH
ncbi:MAG: Ig-like domain-containing protein, partial [Alistipes sp.]|nr:Ig-like domain-containing protein [Candidatus Alistipes equi]